MGAELEEQEITSLQDLDPEMLEELLEAFCTPVRKGGKLNFKCEFCGSMKGTQKETLAHIAEKHEAEVEEALMSAGMDGGMGSMGGMGGMPGEDDLELLMAEMMMGGMGGTGGMGGMPKGASSSRKKR